CWTPAYRSTARRPPPMARRTRRLQHGDRDDPILLEDDDALGFPVGPAHLLDAVVSLDVVDGVGPAEQLPDFLPGHALLGRAALRVALLGDDGPGVGADPVPLRAVHRGAGPEQRPSDRIDDSRDGGLGRVDPVSDAGEDGEEENLANLASAH